MGFTAAPNVYISNATNTNMPVIITTLSPTVLPASVVNTLTITTPGSGFTGNPTLIFFGGGAPTTTATATCTQAAGVINTVTLTNAGAGYTVQPTIAWNGGGNVNITATILGGYVTGFNIVSGGSGFTSAPSIYMNGGGGAGATATCTINAGIIIAVTIVNGGNAGYTAAPTVYVYGGGQLLITPTMYYVFNNIRNRLAIVVVAVAADG